MDRRGCAAATKESSRPCWLAVEVCDGRTAVGGGHHEWQNSWTGLQQALHDARAGPLRAAAGVQGRPAGPVHRLASKGAEGAGRRRGRLPVGPEPFDTATAAGRMMMQMLGVFGEFEREMIVERTRMGLARKAARGEWTGRTPPFGYRYHPERPILVPVPPEAALVQRIFTLYADRRVGSAAISGLLNDAGQPTSRGRRWTPTASSACCATLPTPGGSPSTASSIRPAATHLAPRPPTPWTTC
jgi:Resolvase, N terminal domain